MCTTCNPDDWQAMAANGAVSYRAGRFLYVGVELPACCQHNLTGMVTGGLLTVVGADVTPTNYDGDLR